MEQSVKSLLANRLSLFRVLCLGILLSWGPVAHAYVIDFEALADGAPVGLAYPGVEFSNSTVIRSGVSLNEFEFPPRSGQAVAFDVGGAMQISFAAPVDSFEGFVTYATQLVITAFDASNAVVTTSTTLFGSNLALSGVAGSLPNEQLLLSGGAIRRIEIAGSPAGGSFVLDDVTFRLAATPVPEPMSLLLCGAALVAAASVRRIRSGPA